MDLVEEEPRQIPRPMPFSERSPLQPEVPEVSLLLQDISASPKIISNKIAEKEYETYNAWKWQTINEREKEKIFSRNASCLKKQQFFPVQDKFSGSEIERRKNEILYGSPDEPRRPLPPRAIPAIPNCVEASFSDASFSNDFWIDKNNKENNFNRPKSYVNNNSNNNYKMNEEEIKKACKCKHEDQKEMKDLYQIIADQNRQMVLLQQQIQQLLKSQESKEKQIEQLLKSQESKESKIEQLLKMQDMKENQIEQLLKAQEKHEKQIEQLIMAQDARERQNLELSNQLRSLHKQVVTVGTMTKKIDFHDKSTNTSYQHFCQPEKSSEQIQTFEECSRFDPGDKSFTLQSLELPAIPEQTPTPQSSIHVDLPEYNESSSDEDSDISSTSKEVHIQQILESNPLGYTFYNKVLTQVNDIIHNNNEDKDCDEALKLQAKNADRELESAKQCRRNDFAENQMRMNKSIGSNFEKNWGFGIYEPQNDFQNISKISGNNFYNNGTSGPVKIRSNSEMAKETQSPSDISLRMNALALKYLKEEQISQYQMQFQSQQGSKQPDVTIYNVTNLSFGTMRYLERYRISSHEDNKSDGVPSRHHFLHHKNKAKTNESNFKNS